jgi:hypothetical protein
LLVVSAQLLAAAACSDPRSTSSGQSSQPSASIGLGNCPVTLATGVGPPGQPPSPDYYGNGAIWTNLYPEGIVQAKATDVMPDGSIGIKFGWFRRVNGNLVITGRRLDAAAAPLRGDIPAGYGDVGFQASGVIFPTSGCWEVTGRVGSHSLKFVTLLVKP